MKRLLSILLLSYSICCLGQESSEKKGIKFWSEGKLTEEDFQIRRSTDISNVVPGVLDWTVSFDREKAKVGNLNITYLQSRTYMDKLLSWINPDKFHPWSLSYLQTEFNIVEAYRRRFQDQLNQNPLDYSQIRDYNMRLMRNAIETFQMESEYGNDSGVIVRYETQYEAELENWEETPLQAPEIKPKGLGSHLFVSYLGEFSGQPLSDGIGPSHGLLFGYGFLFSRFMIGLEGSFYVPGTLKADNFYFDPKYSYNWQRDVRYSQGLMGFNAGYILLDRPSFSLRPEVGLGARSYDQKLPEDYVQDSNKSSELSGLRFYAGLNFNFKLSRNLDLYYSGNYTETNLTIKVLGGITNFKSMGTVPFFGLGIGMAFDGWLSIK
ncbi:MAG: hypothetical protein IJM29_02725 [Bacteroidales bacterium]|nr:hypothetical protein [Bacteroidales bacterium]